MIKIIENKSKITDWDKYYKENINSNMPWYSDILDFDLENELKKRNINSGKFLDLGTGPATQALELSKIGFDVTGSDISESAVRKARKLTDKVNFVQDDILDTKINEQFDFIFDRGCFHTVKPETRQTAVKNIYKMMKPEGFYFMKCFSVKQGGDDGPYRFSPEELEKYFGNDFKIHSIIDTEFVSKNNTRPKALFCVIQKIRK